MTLKGASSAETQHSDSTRNAPDTREEHGLLHRTDKKKKKGRKKKKKIFYKQTHILKQTLLLQTNKAGGWQAMGNGRTE